MKRLTLLSTIMLVFAVGTAVAQDIRYDFDKSKDFSKYKTYKWVPIKGADQPDQLTTAKVTSAVDVELAAGTLTEDSNVLN